MKNKLRLDLALVEKKLVSSREKAKAIIMSGIVFVDNQKIDKSGTLVNIDSNIEIRGNTLAYVSRGGLKLEKALKKFNVNLEQKVAMDIGASTGGFTDCMLQYHVAKVYAVDVGYGQLAYKLRNDSRVVNLERTNIRYLEDSIIQDSIDFVSIDVSFISLKLVLPAIKSFLSPEAELVCLIKPQFEAGRKYVGKNGVVSDINVHKSVIFGIVQFARENGYLDLDLDFSPITGPKGNIEYLLYLSNSINDTHDNTAKENTVDESYITKVVEKSHKELKKEKTYKSQKGF